MHRAAARIRRWAHDESLLLALLAGSFVARWLVADRNSYWLDELYSVAVYGIWNGSAVEAVRNLAENSVHPPLYQFLLYLWMQVFGDAETATRMLSNVFVTLATLLLYLLLREGFARRIALASATAFAFMYLPMYYALETRSYAQMVLLATLSSYALVRLMRRGRTDEWTALVRAPVTATFVLANVALLLTHYYAIFFWVAQAILAALYVVVERPARRWVRAFGVVVAAYVLQLAIFAAVWGGVLVGDFRRRSAAYTVDGEVKTPLDLLLGHIVTPNFQVPLVIAVAGLACACLLVVRFLRRLVRAGGPAGDRRRAWIVVYLVGWLILPAVVVSLAFTVLGVERYNMRYFLYSVVPLAPLLMLTVEEVVRLVDRAWRWWRGTALPSMVPGLAVAAAIVTLVLPGAYAAATASKDDWRGNVRRVVDVVERDDRADYAVLEASHRPLSMATYYVERFSDTVRVQAALPIDEERDGSLDTLGDVLPELDRYDYVIMLFPHLGVDDFPLTLRQLEQRYQVHHRQLDVRGRGFVIFSTETD